MNAQNEYKPFKQLSFKDIQNLLIISESSAKQTLNDIKKHFEVKKVLFQHFKNYFKV